MHTVRLEMGNACNKNSGTGEKHSHDVIARIVQMEENNAKNSSYNENENMKNSQQSDR